MASFYERGNVFWVKYKGNDGKPHRESTNLPTDTVEGKREAKRIADELSLKERLITGQDSGSKFSEWVMAYLQQRYSHKLCDSLSFHKGQLQAIRGGQGVLRDEIIELTVEKTRAQYPQTLRRVVARVEVDGRERVRA